MCYAVGLYEDGTMAPDVAPRTEGIDEHARDALNSFALALDQAYGRRVRNLVVFGSRARQQASQDSDIDVAVVLDRLDGRRYDERMRMTDLAYEILVSTGVDIQAWPVTVAEWSGQEEHSNPGLLLNMKRDGIEFGAPLAA